MTMFDYSFGSDFDKACGDLSTPSISNFTFTPNGGDHMDTASKISIVPDPVIEETPPTPEPCAEETCETVEAMKLFYKNDFEAIAEDFIKEHYTVGDHRLVHFFDGHLHCYNGRCYEKQTNTIFPQLRRNIREYVKTLHLVNDKGQEVHTPTTTSFYKQLEAAIGRICELTKEEVEKFKTQPSHLIYGKTRIWNMETDTFHEYSPSIQTTYTLEHDVAETVDEPEVWQEFFEKSGMGEEQQRAWWYMLSVILMKDKSHNRLFYLFGNPRSGKGITSRICEKMFDKEQVTAIPGNMGNPHDTSIIVGKLLLTVNDMKFDKQTNRSFVRFLLNVVGNDPITINPKYKALYDYLAESNVIITSNEMPDFKGNLSGLEKKFAFLVFQRTGEIDPTLESRMFDSMPQIIRKAANMYKEAVASGYAFDTEQGQKVAEQFLESSSVVREFIEEKCVLGKGNQVGTLEMYNKFIEFASPRRERIPSMSQFVKEIMTLYFGQVEKDRINVPGSKQGKTHYDKMMVFRGIGLISPSDRQPHPALNRVTIDNALNENHAMTLQSMGSQV